MRPGRRAVLAFRYTYIYKIIIMKFSPRSIHRQRGIVMRIKKRLSISLIAIMLSTFIMQLSAPSAEANAVWERPQIVPIPTTVTGTQNPVINLNGTWKFTMSDINEFWNNTVDPSSWDNIQVPGEAVMQNFDVQLNHEYAYKKEIDVPADFEDKTVVLRFEGVYSYARVWVNGEFVRDHTGGFTAWDADITPYVKPGQKNTITVGVTSKSDDISNENQYTKHNLLGILRNVKLIALPETYATRIHVTTDFDATFTDSTLKVTGAVDLGEASNAKINLSLKDPQGNAVALSPSTIDVTASNEDGTVSIPVTAPQKWDAEHPNLYTLTADVEVGGAVVQSVTKKIGFRKVVRSGNKVLVNGNEVKLRGINSHDVEPLLGRATTDELDDATVAKFAEANINLIRTSHYPKSDAFLEAADKYGVYVVSETAVVWQGGEWDVNPNSVADPNYTDEYMNQFSEMIEKDMSHPSVIIWSLGNETIWGMNFQKELDYAKAEDPSRLTIVSWGNLATDIWSSHYPNYNGNLGSTNQPVLHDEYAHVNNYNTGTQQRDPNVRNFWGESIKKFWENMFPTSGALGGAIWASPDEVFMSPLNNWSGGYGGWGIIDGWRRDKPEFWLTKKAYSPIRITDAAVTNPGSGQPLEIPIKNWYDHMNFNEITFKWSVGDESGSITNLNVGPHGQGTLVIPARNWEDGEILNIQALNPSSPLSTKLIDEYNLPIGGLDKTFTVAQSAVPTVTEDESSITVTGSKFSIVLNKATGQITNGSYNGETVIVGGPRINLAPVVLTNWKLTSMTHAMQDDVAIIDISGTYGTVGATFKLKIDGAGLVTTDYKITSPKAGAQETGVIYDLSGSIDQLSWDRKGLWSAYPADHIGRTTGVANKISGNNDTYRVKPTWSWSEDMKDFFLYGSEDKGDRGTNDFRSQKENIYYASAILGDSTSRLRAESAGKDAVRMEISQSVADDQDPAITYTGTWSSYNDAGDFGGSEKYSNTVGASAEYKFTGTGISFIGPKNNNLGTVDIYLDDVLVEENLSLNAPSKNYQQVLFKRTGLENGQHTIKVVVKSQFVVVDAFKPITEGGTKSIAMMINNQWAYSDVDWGNYDTTITVPSGYSNTVKMRLTDNDSYKQDEGEVVVEGERSVMVGPDKVKKGEAFSVELGMKSVAKATYAQDIVIEYDADAFEFKDAKPLLTGLNIVKVVNDVPGKIRILAAITGVPEGIKGDATMIDLQFVAKDVEKSGKIEVKSFTFADAEGKESDAKTTFLDVEVKDADVVIVIDGDLNGDGKVSIGDLAIVAANYGKVSTDPTWNPKADVKKDGVIDINDLSQVAQLITN